MSFVQALAVIGLLSPSVNAHGFVKGIVAAGIFYRGYDNAFRFTWPGPPPVVPGWTTDAMLEGYIEPNEFRDDKIICHNHSTPAGTSAKIAAGQVVELQWTTWPPSHHGPVIDYLAKCPGNCTDVDKTTLKFFKIGEGGLIDGSKIPGIWASDELIGNNNSWSVQIPTSIAPGNYVLRHEIIALHVAGDPNGAQLYPQCINLEITSDGTDNPAGVLGTDLYKADDPGILTNIYKEMSPYTIPGGPLYSGAIKATQAVMSITASAPDVTASSTSSGSMSSYATVSTTTAAAAPSSKVEAPISSSSAAAAAAETKSSATTPFVTLGASSSSTVEYGATVTDDCTTTVITVVTEYANDQSSIVSTAAAAAAETEPTTTTTLHSTVFVSASTPGAYAASPTTGSSPAAPQGYEWGSKPSKPLPQGWKMKDLLEWVVYLMEKPSKKTQKRAHGRDFVQT